MNIEDTEFLNTLEFVDAREREHFAKAQLGEQIRAFLTSPAGRFLHGRAKLQLQEAQVQALDCNLDSFFGRRKLKRLQKEGGIATAFMSWCADALQEAELSYRELQEYDNNR